MPMNLQGVKNGYPLAVVTTTNGATALSSAIDTAGYDELQVVVSASASNAATNNFSVLKLTTSDTSGGTYTDLEGYVGDSDFTIADADTASNYSTVLNVDLRGKKRYFKVSISPTTSQNIGATTILARAAVAPTSASASGVHQIVNP